MRLGTAIIIASLCSAAAANAAVEVIGSGPAHQCYTMAARDFGATAGEDICTLALQDTLLTTHDRAATLVNRGVIRTRLNRMDSALIDNNQAIALGQALSPADLGVAYVNRASVLNALGRHREALASADKGLSLGAANPEIGCYARAVAEEMLGDITAAYHDYKRAADLRPGFAPAEIQLTRFHVEHRRLEGS